MGSQLRIGFSNSSARLSPCGLYRYHLARSWDRRDRRAVFIMCNPSTADAETDDPTIRRCLGFARRWRCGGIEVVNLFALRATDPRELLRKPRAVLVGPDNNAAIDEVIAAAQTIVVVAWGGVPAPLRWRAEEVLERLRRAGVAPGCLGTTGEGLPRHPLMVPYSQALEPFPLRPLADGGAHVA